MIDFDQLKSNESITKEQNEDYFEIGQNQSEVIEEIDNVF